VTLPGQTPASIWDSSVVPATPAANDNGPIEVGVKFRPATSGHVTGIRFYKGAGNTGTHTGTLWKGDGTPLGSVNFTNETGSGWQQANFTTAIPVTAGQTYVASYYAPAGHYGVTASMFASAAVDRPPLQALRSGTDGGNGVYKYGATGFPSSDFNASWYGVDLVFLDLVGPSVVSTTPASGATGVPLDAQVMATFGEPINASGLTFTLRDDTAGQNVAGSFSYDSGTATVTFSPTASLAPGHGFTAKVGGAKDVAGNAMSGQYQWSFTSVAVGLLSFWTPSTVPAVTSANDSGAIEVGVKFRVDVAGSVVGVRFYKGSGNSGTHVGRLWRADGALLGQVNFTGESASGWQQMNFTAPVAVVPGTTYVASYYAPNGHYAANGGFFSTGVDNGVIHALANGVDGGNGVYLYASGGGFPTNSFNAGNYWVDIAFAEGT
jgi:Domain of unknown function (DUF4082)/Bacterial Ig-like domain